MFWRLRISDMHFTWLIHNEQDNELDSLVPIVILPVFSVSH